MKHWFWLVFHNCIAHPLLVLAAIFNKVGLNYFRDCLFWLHDVSVPED